MKASVFEYKDYKKFINDLIVLYPKAGRGIRRQLAEAMRCQVAYVSHVLAGNYHFSAEQAEAAGRFLGLSSEETEYLLLLVGHNRAGTHELRQSYERMLSEKARKNQLLKNRLKIKETLSGEAHAIYYSHWYYAAIHVVLTIPRYQTREEISRKLGLPVRRVGEVLEFLVSHGLARREGTTYKVESAILHLEKDSPWVARHHANWRVCAINSLAEERTHDTHYSSAFTCSEKDLPKIRERLAQALEECTEIIRPSKEERIAGLCIDLFEL